MSFCCSLREVSCQCRVIGRVIALELSSNSASLPLCQREGNTPPQEASPFCKGDKGSRGDVNILKIHIQTYAGLRFQSALSVLVLDENAIFLRNIC